MSALQPDLQDAVVVTRGSQTHVRDSAQAASIAAHLAEALAAAGMANAHTGKASYGQEQWLLEGLWRIALCLLASIRTARSTSPVKKALTRICHSSSTILAMLGNLAAAHRPHRAISGILQCVLQHDLLAKDHNLQLAVCNLLLVSGPVSKHVEGTRDDAFLAHIEGLMQDEENFLTLHEDLRKALSSASVHTRPVPVDEEKIVMKSVTSNGVARQPLRQGDTTSIDWTKAVAFDDSNRPSKRRRGGDYDLRESSNSNHHTLVQQLSSKLGSGHHSSLVGIQIDVAERLEALPLQEQETALSILAEIPCRGWGARTEDPPPLPKRQTCLICWRTLSSKREHGASEEAQAYERILSRLLSWPGIHRLKRPRVLVMLAIQRYVNHAAEGESLDISKSPLGQWCLKSLHSSLRELRIAAGRSVGAFVRTDIPGNIRRTNVTYTVNFLRALGERNNLAEKETLVLTWGQIARVCGSENLNIALLELVNNLSAAHPLICSLAYDEIQRCAEYRRVTVEALFRPYWRTIAVAAVRDLRTKPQKLHRLCDLLEMGSLNRFLLQTQAETIPYLVANKEHEILSRIAAARNESVANICVNPSKHLSLILATLLLQYTSNTEAAVMEALCEVVPEFESMDLAKLIRMEPVQIACEMFKVAGETSSDNKASVHQAVKAFVALAERKTGQAKPVSRSTKLLAQFLDQHILGILTRLSDVVDAPGETYAIAEKRRCLHAIAEMVSMAQAHFSFAVAAPQIKACMQSALKEPSLCDDAMALWSIFASSLGTDDLDDALEYTFAMIASTWTQLTTNTQSTANDLIAHFIKSHNALVREKILYLCSLSSIPLFSKYEAEIQKFKNLEPLTRRLEAFRTRCSSQTALICQQGVSELLRYLTANQRAVQDLASSPEPHSVVVDLIHALINAASRFAVEHPLIRSLIGESLGVIGCIDAQESRPIEDHPKIVVLSNFERVSETVDFIAYFLEHVLIKAFHSASNSRIQNYLAWAMQELIKHCDFQAPISRSKSSQTATHSERWMSMSDMARNTLLPFFDTKYMLTRSTESLVDRDRRAPIFSITKSHSDWLREIVADLLQRDHGNNAEIFFPVLSKIIRGHDLSIPRFLLPYIANNILLAGSEVERETMRQEMLLILETDVEPLESAQAENVRKASEVRSCAPAEVTVTDPAERVRDSRLPGSMATTQTQAAQRRSH